MLECCQAYDYTPLTVQLTLMVASSLFNVELFTVDCVNFSKSVTDYNNFVFNYTNYMYHKYPGFNEEYDMVNETLENMMKYTRNMTEYTQNMIKSPTDEKHYIDGVENYTKLMENVFNMISLYIKVIRNYIRQHIYPRSDTALSLPLDLVYTSVMQDATEEMTLNLKQIANSISLAKRRSQEKLDLIEELNRNITRMKISLAVCLFTATIDFLMFSVGLPVICVAGYALFRLVKASNLVPVIFVINLLISNLINLLARIVNYLPGLTFISMNAKYYFMYFFVFTSIFFMMSISLERYLVIVHPLWYKSHRSLKSSLMVSSAVWLTSATLVLVFENTLPVVVMLYLIPFPFLAFFTVGAWRGLSAAISVSVNDKRKIMGTLKLVLATYTILYLPYICTLMYKNITSIDDKMTSNIEDTTLYWSFLSGLVQPIQFVYLRNGAVDTLVLFPCCRTLRAKLRDWKRSTGSSQAETTPNAAATTVNTVDMVTIVPDNVPRV